MKSRQSTADSARSFTLSVTSYLRRTSMRRFWIQRYALREAMLAAGLPMDGSVVQCEADDVVVTGSSIEFCGARCRIEGCIPPAETPDCRCFSDIFVDTDEVRFPPPGRYMMETFVFVNRNVGIGKPTLTISIHNFRPKGASRSGATPEHTESRYLLPV